MNTNELAQQLVVYTEFYEKGKPLISDAEFDLLENQLREEDPDHSYFKRVGSAVRGIKVEHKIPMGSLTQFDEEEEIQRWISKHDLANQVFIVTDKLDGSSVSVEYDEYGNFIRALTRGDGVEGLDITRHVNRMIRQEVTDIPSTSLPNMIVRGEMIMTIDTFNAINHDGKYKNPRNYVAGQLNRTVADDGFIENVSFIAFSSNWTRGQSFVEQLEILTNEDFCTPFYCIVTYSDINRDWLMNHLDQRKDRSDFELDGLVIDVNDRSVRDSIGFDGLNPEYARKFKVNVNFVEAEVVAVHWGTSKDGYLKPRIEIEPIELAGVTITFATGHNAKNIVDNKIGPGAIVQVTRSGEVIPYIQGVTKQAPYPSLPDMNRCHWNETGVDLVWNEIPDEARLLQIVDFFSAIDAPMLKEGNVTTLFELGFTTIESIINASEDQLVTALGENGIKAYLGLRDKLNPIEEWRLAGATPFFGRGVGQRKMKKLFEHYPQLEGLTVGDITKIGGFEEKTAEKIVDGIARYHEMISAISDQITLVKYEKKEGDLSGTCVVFTGVRDKALEKTIEDRGGKVASSFTREVNVVVAKDPNGSSSKLKKARESGAEVISHVGAKERWGV